MKPPCMNCTLRTLGCHSTCSLYKEYKASVITRAPDADETNDMVAYKRSVSHRIRKRAKLRKGKE